MGLRSLPLLTALLAILPLGAQPTSSQTSVYTYDSNGRRVPSGTYSMTGGPMGSERLETTRSINGRTVPAQTSQDKVISQTRNTKVTERTVTNYDANGRPAGVERIRIEETKRADGGSSIVATTYRSDINGSQRLAERTSTEVRKSGSAETAVTSIERPAANGSLEIVEKKNAVTEKMGDNSKVESTVYRKDVNGGMYTALSEVSTTTKSGNVEATDTAQYVRGPDGNMELDKRIVGKTTSQPNGGQVEQIEVYAKTTASNVGDINARQPRLQQEIVRESVPGPNNTIVETTSIRARAVNDPSRFTDYEKTKQVIQQSQNAAGMQVTNQRTVVERRDVNGNLIVEKEVVRNSVAPMPVTPPQPQAAAPAPKK